MNKGIRGIGLQLKYVIMLVFMLVWLALFLMLAGTDFRFNRPADPSLFVLALSIFAVLVLFLTIWFYRPLYRLQNLIRHIENGKKSGGPISLPSSRKTVFEQSFLDLINELQQQKEHDYSLEMLKKQAELNALQSQINPHFLYNTLDSIRGQLLMEEQPEVANIIESISNLFRYSINPKTIFNTLEQEFDNIEDYMRIIRYRFGDRYILKKVIDPQNDFILNCEIPKLTLQPIIENSIKHGLEQKMGNGIITIRAFLSDEGLHLSVEDNGVGIQAEALDEMNRKFRDGAPVEVTQGIGIALVNISERIHMLFGQKYGLYVNSVEGIGTEVHILLPANVTPVTKYGR